VLSCIPAPHAAVLLMHTLLVLALPAPRAWRGGLRGGVVDRYIPSQPHATRSAGMRCGVGTTASASHTDLPRPSAPDLAPRAEPHTNTLPSAARASV
jgi:hypothetical protein